MGEKTDGGLLEGKVQHHGRFAFLLSEKPGREDLMLRGPSLRLAMDGDRVQVRLTPGEKGRAVGEIVRVLERARAGVREAFTSPYIDTVNSPYDQIPDYNENAPTGSGLFRVR